MTKRPPGSAATYLANNVRERRNQQGWSQAALADLLTIAGYPIGQGRISHIETHATGVTIDLVDALATVFGCQVADLVRATPHTDMPEEVTRWLATRTAEDVIDAWSQARQQHRGNT